MGRWALAETSFCKMDVCLLRQKKKGFGGEVSFFS